MYFLFVKLTDVKYKEDIILALQSVGITKASCIESTNLERALSDELSLFRGFFKSANELEGEQLIITALIESREQVREIITNLKEADIDIENEDIIRIVVLPILMLYDNSTGLLEL